MSYSVGMAAGTKQYHHVRFGDLVAGEYRMGSLVGVVLDRAELEHGWEHSWPRALCVVQGGSGLAMLALTPEDRVVG